MRRFLFLALLAASLLPFTGPAQAQATADQLNRLSLEALTARPAGGGGGGYIRRSDRPAYRARYRSPYHASYGSPYRGRSYARASYGHARRVRYAPPHRYARRAGTLHRAYVAYRGRAAGHRSFHVRQAAYHRPHRR